MLVQRILVLDPLIIPKLLFFLILIIYLVDSVLIKVSLGHLQELKGYNVLYWGFVSCNRICLII